MIIENKGFRKTVFSSIFLLLLAFPIDFIAQKTERTSWQIPNDSTLILVYNRAVIAPSAANYSLGYFTGEAKRPRRIAQPEDRKQIVLTYASKFPSGVEMLFLVNNVKDYASGLYLPLDYCQVVYTPSKYDSPYRYGDLVITELMFRPSDGSFSLPNAEYFELLNTTDSPIDLRGWRFCRGTTSFGSAQTTLAAGAYAIAVSRNKASLFPSSIQTIPFDGFPALRNECDTFALYDPSNKLIAAVEYRDAWLRGAGAGVSIETIDPTNRVDTPDNWLPSIDPSGGTPGRTNSVGGKCPNVVRPTVKEIYYPSDRQLRIVFSGSMDADSLIEVERYRFSDSSVSIASLQPLLPMCREVVLNLTRPLLPDQNCRLALHSIPSRSGQSLRFPFCEYPLYCPEVPEKGDILINEVLNDPPVADADYLELYNLSSRPMDLSQLRLFSNPISGKPPVSLPVSTLRRAFPPHSYLLLSKRPEEVIFHYAPPDTSSFLRLERMPTLYNDGGDIYLTTADDTLDCLVFGKELHSLFLRDDKGVALERVSLFEPTSRPENWRSASALVRYGTPGYRNSVAGIMDSNQDSPFEFPQQSFSPNYDGRDDTFPIVYCLTDNTLVSISIFTRSGHRVVALVDQQLLVGEGRVEWDGRDDAGILQPPGIYLLQLSGQTDSGKLYQKRKAVVLTLR